MRFAFNLSLDDPNHLRIDLFDAATVSEEGQHASSLAGIQFEKAKGKWILRGTNLNGVIQQEQVLTIKKIAKANLKAMDEKSETGSLSPLLFLRALLSMRAVQLAFDPQLKKYRCVGTMKEGSDSYEAVGTSITVEAKDEDIAVRLAKRAVTERMAEKPEQAAKLAEFFTHGCKVKKVVSGAVPAYLKVETTACGPEEEKLAKQPIKMNTKEDTDE